MNSNYCVYTVLIGDYEQLNEQPIQKDSRIDFFCFTDNRSLVSETWKIIYIDPIFPMDSVRSSRLVKICPHRFLKAYDESLYIDNSMVLKQTPEEIYSELMQDGNTDLVVLNHNYRETVLDEFAAVIQLQYDNLNTILEQLNAYSLICPDVLAEKPIQSGFLFRKHNDANVIETMENWLAQVFRYSRRDQLSVNYSLRKSNLRVRKIECDVFNSKYFQYPVGIGRDPERIKRMGALSTISSYLIGTQQMAEIERLRSKLKEHLDLEQAMQVLLAQVTEEDHPVKALTTKMAEDEQSLQLLAAKVAELANSKAWKTALFFRRILVRIAPPNSRRARGLQKLYRVFVFPIINIIQNKKLEIDMVLVRESGLFDENWYLSNNPDVVAAKIDPVRHYLLFGGFEGRDPGPQFSSSWYLASYDDVRKAGINPLLHYLKSGRNEGRAKQTAIIVHIISNQ
ncbi:MAG: glycosyltransferase domain-containing protein [Anaerolineales bacterium]